MIFIWNGGPTLGDLVDLPWYWWIIIVLWIIFLVWLFWV